MNNRKFVTLSLKESECDALLRLLMDRMIYIDTTVGGPLQDREDDFDDVPTVSHEEFQKMSCDELVALGDSRTVTEEDDKPILRVDHMVDDELAALFNEIAAEYLQERKVLQRIVSILYHAKESTGSLPNA